MRRNAYLLGTTYKTVARRLRYFEKICDDHHANILKTLSEVSQVHFDDMESSIHTKLKPVSIPLAVSHPHRLILAFDVVSMPAKGKEAAISVKKYGKRPDDRPLGWKSVLECLAGVVSKDVQITSDSHASYPKWIKQILPSATHIQVKGRKAAVAGQGELKKGGFDPLFTLNHTAAMFRANVNRLFRKTWCTSKRRDHLRAHMAMYRTWHNELILAKLELRQPALRIGSLKTAVV